MVEIRLTRKLSRGDSFDSVTVVSQDSEAECRDVDLEHFKPKTKPILRNPLPKKPPKRSDTLPVKGHRGKAPKRAQSEPLEPKKRSEVRLRFNDDISYHPNEGGPLTDEEWAAGFYNRQDIEKFKEERSIIAQGE